jgi:hypothetical protein
MGGWHELEGQVSVSKHTYHMDDWRSRSDHVGRRFDRRPGHAYYGLVAVVRPLPVADDASASAVWFVRLERGQPRAPVGAAPSRRAARPANPMSARSRLASMRCSPPTALTGEDASPSPSGELLRRTVHPQRPERVHRQTPEVQRTSRPRRARRIRRPLQRASSTPEPRPALTEPTTRPSSFRPKRRHDASGPSAASSTSTSGRHDRINETRVHRLCTEFGTVEGLIHVNTSSAPLFRRRRPRDAAPWPGKGAASACHPSSGTHAAATVPSRRASVSR